MERRFTKTQTVSLETREDAEPRIVGYGAVFYDGTPDTEYELMDGVVERIDAGAFDRALAEAQDVRGLFNHDASLVLGRTASGTMELTKDERGLRYDIEKANTTVSNDVAEHLKRGDVSGSSFAMVVNKAEWSQETRGEDKQSVDVRTIKDVTLYDVGPVTYPAYSATESALRSDGDVSEIVQERDAWKQVQETAEAHGVDLHAARMRKLSLLKLQD